MRRSPSLYLVLTLLLAAHTAHAGSVTCSAKTWFQNLRSDQKRVCRQMDAGSAHVAVLAVAPWADYVSKLQPDFSVSSEDALKLALPVTSTREETMINAILATLKIAAPTTTLTSSETSKTADGKTTETSETKKETKPGDTSKAEKPGGEDQKPTTDKAKISGTLAVDPMMHRLTALALFQEAKLVSLRMIDTAVPKDYTPYMVSLQITLMPNARREPYDAYTTITFVPTSAPQMSAAYDAVAKQQKYDPTKEVRVVPLLVTDNIESARRADLTQQLVDLSLAATAMAGNTGVSGSVRKQLNRLVSSQSHDFNSLMTVARLSENSIRVRLGAMHANERFAVIPRTHNITLVVMVPKGVEELSYIARTQLNDAVHGTPLSTGTTGMLGWRYENVAAEWIRDYELPKDIGYYYELTSLAQAADYAGFRKHLQDAVFSDAKCDSRCKLQDKTERQHWEKQSAEHLKAQRAAWEKEQARAARENRRPDLPEPQDRERRCDCDYLGIDYSESFRNDAIDRIWADVSNFIGMGQHSKGQFVLPSVSETKRRFFPKVAVTPVDDTTATRVAIRGSRFLDPARVHARLRVVKKDGSTYYLEPAEIKPSGTDGLELKFASLGSIAKAESDLRPESAALMLSYASSQYRWDRGSAIEEAPNMSEVEQAALNDGQEVAYPATILFASKPAS